MIKAQTTIATHVHYMNEKKEDQKNTKQHIHSLRLLGAIIIGL